MNVMGVKAAYMASGWGGADGRNLWMGGHLLARQLHQLNPQWALTSVCVFCSGKAGGTHLLPRQLHQLLVLDDGGTQLQISIQPRRVVGAVDSLGERGGEGL